MKYKYSLAQFTSHLSYHIILPCKQIISSVIYAQILRNPNMVWAREKVERLYTNTLRKKHIERQKLEERITRRERDESEV